MYNERTHHTYLPDWYIKQQEERKKEREKDQAQGSNSK
jgi:hypothetical protein